MKPRTIADKLIAKYGVSYARGLAHGRMRLALYSGPNDHSHVHRGIFWMLIGQMIDKVGTTQGWT
tara:strand:+ start:1001 stop:1195 length:195 start_codon:yes stop_codon:yes gene_type:complete